MTIYIGADHRGFELKNQLYDWLVEQGYKVVDCGNDHIDPEDDFPDFAKAVALNIVKSSHQNGSDTSNPGSMIASKTFEGAFTLPQDFEDEQGSDTSSSSPQNLGILVCGSGIGVCITANRYKGVRCGAAYTPDHIRHGRENDHVNVLGLAADMVDLEQAQKIVHTFLTATPIMKEKYIRRVNKHDML